jgi:hypothetical protein
MRPLSLLLLVCMPAVASDQMMVHIRELTASGGRVAGTPGDLAARRYIERQMKAAGLKVESEPFEYQAFHLKRAELASHDVRAEPIRVLFDPYAASAPITGPAVFLEPKQVTSASAGGSIVVTTTNANPYIVAEYSPRAAVFLKPEDFERFTRAGAKEVTLITEGSVRKVRTANVVGTSPGAAKERVLITAHHDSVNCPGAQDNASGVAVLLKLAMRLAKTRSGIRFIALGAEEDGMLGARAYVARHQQSRRQWKMVFNLDSVGGPGKAYIQMGGVEPRQHTPPHELPLRADGATNWVLQRPRDFSANVPDWLSESVKTAAASMGLEFVPARQMGSDHSVFALAGVPATNIAISGLTSHVPEDTPARIVPESLEKAARLVESVVRQLGY